LRSWRLRTSPPLAAYLKKFRRGVSRDLTNPRCIIKSRLTAVRLRCNSEGWVRFSSLSSSTSHAFIDRHASVYPVRAATTTRRRRVGLCSQGRRTGNRRCGQLRNGAADVKNNGMTNRKIEYWVIPSEADGEFVANMEEVLETYAKP